MWLIHRSGDFVTEGVELEVLGDVLTIYIKRNLVKPWNILIKSLFDKCLTILLLLILFPLFLVIALAIKLESKGPVIFIQDRIGKYRKTFKICKFRSMYLDNESRLKAYLEAHPEAKEEWERFRKLKNHDPRVTKVGRFIRKFSLDEIPQLLNVLQSKMSLVGPRPYLPEELENRKQISETIARVKPGLTGLWQISGRSDIAFEERLNMDEYYIRNWSLWLDIVIILKSLKAWLEGKGAY
jgi:undecaprenyl-phosphate galactose phosphotransferase